MCDADGPLQVLKQQSAVPCCKQSPRYATSKILSLSPPPSPATIAEMKKIIRKLRERKSKKDEAGQILEEPADLVLAPAVCLVCRNLSPGSDGEHEGRQDKWAMTEFDIPEDTPATRVGIERPEDLLESAKLGCRYCFIVMSALDTMQPGWKTERTFLDLCLARDLPAVIQLKQGARTITKMGREAMLEFGVELPQQQNVNVTITARKITSKPDIDVEIYRPTFDSFQNTSGGRLLIPSDYQDEK